MTIGNDKHVFVSYVREDSKQVRNLCSLLDAAQIPYWKDRESLAPGDQWRQKIREAIREDALVFLACFSENSQERNESFMNEELTIAVEEFRRRSPGTKWLIPVRFDDEKIPYWDLGAGRDLNDLNYANLFGDNHAQEGVNLISTIGKILADPGERGDIKDASVPRRWLRHRSLLLTALVAVLIVGTAAVIQFGLPFVIATGSPRMPPQPKTSSIPKSPTSTSSQPETDRGSHQPTSEGPIVTPTRTATTNPTGTSVAPAEPGVKTTCTSHDFYTGDRQRKLSICVDSASTGRGRVVMHTFKRTAPNGWATAISQSISLNLAVVKYFGNDHEFGEDHSPNSCRVDSITGPMTCSVTSDDRVTFFSPAVSTICASYQTVVTKVSWRDDRGDAHVALTNIPGRGSC